MTTWAELLAEIRADLQDTSDNPRWSDEMLFVFAKDAIRDYSTWFPRRIDREELSLNHAETGYTLPADFLGAVFVECPEDHYLEPRTPRPGIRYASRSGRPFFYQVQGGTIYLDSSPYEGDEVLLTYAAVHQLPIADCTALVLAETALESGTQELTGPFDSPDVPNVLSVTGFEPSGPTGPLTGNVTISGTDENDDAATDTIALDSTDTVFGDQIFKTITKIGLPGWLEDGNAVSVGLQVDLTIPTSDEELIRIFIKAKVFEQMRGRQATLDRFKDRATSGSDRQDNPMMPEVSSVMDEYYRKIALRIGGGAVMLHRIGRIA